VIPTVSDGPSDDALAEPGAAIDVESSPAAGDPVDAAEPAPARTRRPTPWLLLPAVVMVLVPVRAATHSLEDIDLYWHLIIGNEILDGTPIAEAGRGWSFAPVPDTWVSTQWLAEILFAWMHRVGGFDAFILWRSLTTVAALVVLALVTLVGRPARAAAFPFALAGLAVAITGQDRSQQLTYVLAPLVGWWAYKLWREGRVPRWWIVVPLVVVWANFHGGWVLLPGCLALAAVARVVDHGWRDRPARWGLVVAVAAGLASAVSPSGLGNTLATVRFSGATDLIGEWGKVKVWDWQATALTSLVVIVALAWALGRTRPSVGEIVLVLPLLGFGYFAWRSVTPTSLILAPIVTYTIARSLGDPDPLPPGTRQPLRRVAIGAAVAGLLLAVFASVTQKPVLDPDYPLTLFAKIAANPQPQRVLNTYNVAGPLLWFGGGPPHVTVGVDGRADRYGGAYIDNYLNGMIAARPGWETLFDQLHPQVAVLRTNEPLGAILVTQRHWVEVAREGRTALLRAPDAPGW